MYCNVSYQQRQTIFRKVVIDAYLKCIHAVVTSSKIAVKTYIETTML